MSEMSDIVKRLRSPVRIATETQDQAKQRHFFERGEAADEIERLLADNEELAGSLEMLRGEEWWPQRAENALAKHRGK